MGLKYYQLDQDLLNKALNHESLYQGNIDLRAMMRLAKADEIPLHPKLRVITTAEFEGAVRAVKSLVTSYEYTVDGLKSALQTATKEFEDFKNGYATPEEEDLDGTGEDEDSDCESYEFEETVNGWDLRYSAENLWVQELMEAVIASANILGVVKLTNYIKTKI